MIDGLPLDRGLLLFLVGCGSVVLLMPLLIRAAPRLGMIDDPAQDDRRVHRHPVPRIGGVALMAGIALSALAMHPLPAGWPWLAGGLAMLLAAGIIDDRRGLGPLPKLAAQVSAAALAVYGGGWSLAAVPLPLTPWTATDPLWCQAVSLLLTVGIINATNLIDGLDGLCAGTGAVAALALAAIAGLAGDTTLCLTGAALAGCLVGTLAFNSHPARVFLGDTGSMATGFLLAVLAIGVASPRPADLAGTSPFLPLLVLVIPWADCIYVMVSRILHGSNPFRGDRTHVHHQMLSLGLDHRVAVVALVGLGALIAAGALVLRHAPHDTLFLLCIVVAQAVIFGLRYLNRSRLWRRTALRLERLRRRLDLAQTGASRLTGGRQLAGWVAALAATTAACCLPAAGQVDATAAVIAGVSGGLVLGASALARAGHRPLEPLAAAVAGAVLGYAAQTWHAGQATQLPVYGLRLATVALFATALVLIWRRRRLHLLISAPLDFVVLACLLAVLALSEDRLGVRPQPVMLMSLAWYLVAKSAEDDPSWTGRLPFLALLAGCGALAASALLR